MARIVQALLCLACARALNQRLQDDVQPDSVAGAWPVGPQTGSLPCAINTGKYPGQGWHKEGQTVGRRCLYQSEREWVEVHSRQARAGAALQQVLWINQPDRVHVLVHVRSKDRFLVLKRGGYSLEGQSYEVASGHVAHKEKPAAAVRRVAQEVLQVPRSGCRQPQMLGRHRADAEHGLGWIFSFVMECRMPPDAARRRLEAADGEERPQLAQLTRPQLRKAITGGSFAEATWSNSAAMALLRAQELRSASKISAKEAEEQDRHEALETNSQAGGSTGESSSQASDVEEEQAMHHMFDDSYVGGSNNKSSVGEQDPASHGSFGGNLPDAGPVAQDAPGTGQRGDSVGTEGALDAADGQAANDALGASQPGQSGVAPVDEEILKDFNGVSLHVDEEQKGAAKPGRASGGVLMLGAVALCTLNSQ